jgi:S-formylglutathione hydrolase FrmB
MSPSRSIEGRTTPGRPRPGAAAALAFALLWPAVPAAAGFRTLQMRSASFDREFPVRVVTPSDYTAAVPARYRCLYLLHCAGANERFWERVAPLQLTADRYALLIVMPTTGPHSWYVDYGTNNYTETYIVNELMPEIDRRFRTTATNRYWTAGFSMGGYGALRLASRHPQRFSAAGGMGAGITVSRWGGRWRLNHAMGPASGRAVYDLFDPPMIAAVKSAGLVLALACGTSDFFYAENAAAHARLESGSVPHLWVPHPGGHGAMLGEMLGRILEHFRQHDARTP